VRRVGQALEGGVERQHALGAVAGDRAAQRRLGRRHAILIVGVAILAHNPFLRATVTNFFFFFALNAFLLLPLWIRALGGTEIEIGLVMGLYSAVGIVCQPLIGPWVDAFGRRPFMIGGTVLVLLSSLLTMAAPGIGWLAAARVLQGLGFSAYFVAAFSYVVDLVPPARRGWALGIYGVSGFVATALAPLASEWVVRAWGFRPLWGLSAALGLIPVAFAWRLREAAPGGARPVPASVRAGLEDVTRRPMVLTLFFGLGSGTIFTFLPTFAETLGVAVLSLFYTAYAGAAIGVRVFGGRLIDRRGRRAVIVPSMFLQAGAPALLALTGLLVGRQSAVPVIPVLVVAGVLSGAAHGFLYPGLAALVTDLAPEARRAAVIGVFSAMYLVGQAGGAVVFGYVTHALGYALMWAALTALLLGGAGVSLRLERPHDAGAVPQYTARTERGGGATMTTSVRVLMIALVALAAAAAERAAPVSAAPPAASERPQSAPKPGPQEVDVVAVVADPRTLTPLVVLQRKRDGRHFSMSIDAANATSIALPLQGATPPRPLTHDLFLTLFGRLNVTLKRVVITDLRDDVYYAVVYLNAGAQEMTLDSRPSDAIALAIRARVPVLVEDRVFDKTGREPLPRRPSI
jgi:MFS family permease/bifunctional DNase/RNase